MQNWDKNAFHAAWLRHDAQARVKAATDDLLVATAAAETLDGLAGVDTVTYARSNAGVTVQLLTGLGHGGFAAGDQLVSIENLNGSTHDDILGGDGKANTLNGGKGDDALNGHAGNDTLRGGDGNDHLTGGSGADVLAGNAGNDWINYYASASYIRVSLLTGEGSGGDAEGDTISGVENILGSRHSDALGGNGSANVLYGDDGNDVLRGLGGNDVLRGGRGGDRLEGGEGIDWATYAGATDGVTVDLTTGRGYGNEAAGDRLSGIENIEGSNHNDVLTGDDGANTLYGGNGLDTLHGGGGEDRLSGGDGSDFLTGGSGIDIIRGGDGNDLIDAGTGRDIISGGAGNDTIYGGPDPDIICYDAAWNELTATYDGHDYSIWVEAPDGTDHIYTALTIATTTGTYRYDVPTATWVFDSAMTSADWLAG